ncbi:dihydroneopterin aldolase [Aquibacillus sp. 3ASR75-11]|uniref:7,8-dihydroneopterin aldolase n=1 Tax=Terrihalobacillus insolitus TaxID=2950438 RepID=A0A9X3WZP5_9BACI|nr:dihydroneopterin aldolase [Terrihalobacillus insolitus]MDC3414845.1 dihydroneopterin aldolase [Terrihalobacillus insolitus]MDC3426244.1 dihydroneopterin aldolase [Terrihalobacillus insolitus]
MDKIYLNRMEFYGYHGVFPEEKRLGQRYMVDVALELDLKVPGETDKMEDSIDYGRVYEMTKNIVEGDAKNLIETVAENIANQFFAKFDKLSGCTVKVIKPNPPIPGHYQSVGVEIHRTRSI